MTVGRETTSVNRADLHIGLLPREAWIRKLNYAQFQSISEAVSLGFIRVDPELSLSSIRREIARQVRFSQTFTFLRHVGRALVVVQRNQETEIKGKHYLPPHSASYEILLLPGGEHLYMKKEPSLEEQDSVIQLPKRESTRTILRSLAGRGFLSSELADRLADDCETNRPLAKTIRHLHEKGLLADLLRFFDNDEDRERFLHWLSEQSNLDDILKNMETDPFSGIKQYLISQGTFWNDTETEADTEVDKRRKFIWGSVQRKNNFNAAERFKQLEEKFEQGRRSQERQPSGLRPSKSNASPTRSVATVGGKVGNRKSSDEKSNHSKKSISFEPLESAFIQIQASSDPVQQYNGNVESDVLPDVARNTISTDYGRSLDKIGRSSVNSKKSYDDQNPDQEQYAEELNRVKETQRRRNVSRLAQSKRDRKTAEEKRLSIVENERTVKEEISKSEDNRNQLMKLIELEIERSKRLEKEKNYLRSRNKFKSKNPDSKDKINYQTQSHRDRVMQLSAQIQHTKDIIDGTKNRMENESVRRAKVEARLRRVRSEMTRAKIRHHRTFRSSGNQALK